MWTSIFLNPAAGANFSAKSFGEIPPLLKFVYPEGVWTGLCETCLESADKTRVKVEKEELEGTPGKCDLCGSKTDLYPVELRIPNFSKGVVTENAMLCEKCLKAAGETYVKFKREQAEHGHGHH